MRHGHEVAALATLTQGVAALPLDRLDLVAAAGGDGTIAAAARALAGSLVPLGILAMGTANNIAVCLGVPTTLDDAIADWATARATAARSRRRHRAVGRTAVRRERRWRSGHPRHRRDGPAGRRRAPRRPRSSSGPCGPTPRCSASSTRSVDVDPRRRAGRGRVPDGGSDERRHDRPEPATGRWRLALGRPADGGRRRQRRSARARAISARAGLRRRRPAGAGHLARARGEIWPAIASMSTTTWSANRARSARASVSRPERAGAGPGIPDAPGRAIRRHAIGPGYPQ